MKKIDIAIVRYLPIFLLGIMVYIVFNSWIGNTNVNYEAINSLHSNSFFYAMALFIISLTDKRYHCVWNRAMYIELALVPLLNWLDANFSLFPTTYSYLLVITLSLVLTLLITLILAIRHFVRPRLKKYGC